METTHLIEIGSLVESHITNHLSQLPSGEGTNLSGPRDWSRSLFIRAFALVNACALAIVKWAHSAFGEGNVTPLFLQSDVSTAIESFF